MEVLRLGWDTNSSRAALVTFSSFATVLKWLSWFSSILFSPHVVEMDAYFSILHDFILPVKQGTPLTPDNDWKKMAFFMGKP